MEAKNIKKKGINGVKTIIFGRTLIVLCAFVIQFLFLYFLYRALAERSFEIYGLFRGLMAIVLFRLLSSSGNPEFRLAWMLPMVIFPVFGAVFYLYIRIDPGAGKIYERLQKLSLYTREYLDGDGAAGEALEQTDLQVGRMADYIRKYANCRVYHKTRAVYYPLGDVQFEALMEDLRSAEKFIFMEYFIIKEGYLWHEVLEVLKEKVTQGVEVRVMYDGMCALSLLPDFYPKVLEQYGIRCKMYAPIHPVFSSHYNNRDHRKILVVDGRIAHTGGTNLADEYINREERFGHWKDTAIRLEGDAVERFTFMFLEMWNITEKGEETYLKYKTPPEFYREPDGFFIPYDVCPYRKARTGRRVYLDILNTARKYVHIMTPYLILDHEMIGALTYAAGRGVEVVILMPHIPDKKYAFIVARTYYEELMEAGVKIYEYTPGFVHAKVFVADDERAVVGTINLDYRSLYHHFECGVFLYRNSQIARIEQDFTETLEKSQRITAADCRNFPLWEKFGGKALRILAPLM